MLLEQLIRYIVLRLWSENPDIGVVIEVNHNGVVRGCFLFCSGVASAEARGALYPLDSENFVKNREKEGKIRKNREKEAENQEK